MINLVEIFADNAVGILVGVGGGILLNRWRTERERNAIKNNDMGFRNGIVSYTTYDRDTETGLFRQVMTTVNDDLDLAVVFNGKAGKRYLRHFERAAELAMESDNPIVLDHLKKAVEDTPLHRMLDKMMPEKMSGWLKKAVSFAFPPDDCELVKSYVIRKIRNRLSSAEELPNYIDKYPRLLEGADTSQEYIRYYPVLVAEKGAVNRELKILLLRAHDLVEGNIPKSRYEVSVEVNDGQFVANPDLPHAYRANTVATAVDWLKRDEMANANRVFVRVPVTAALRAG